MLGLLGACSVSQINENGLQKDEEKTVGSLAMARWQAKINGEFDKAYDYFSPAYRQATPKSNFLRRMYRGKVAWRGTELKSVKCDGAVCDVSMTLEYDAKGMIGIKTHIEEVWVHQEGHWWFTYK